MSEQKNICKYIDCFPTPKILIRSLYLILAIGNLFGHVVACSWCSDRGDHTKRCQQKQETIIGSWQKKKKKKKQRGGTALSERLEQASHVDMFSFALQGNTEINDWNWSILLCF